MPVRRFAARLSPLVADASASLVQKLRNGTFIIPSTGERSRRNFTLRAHPAAHTARQTDGPDDATSDFALFSPSTWPGKADTVKQILLGWVLFLAKWLVSPPGRGVLKCTLAYTLASLWTFWAPLSAILGTPDGKHVVATITVYFHPARSAGSMIEAVLIAIVAVAYAQSVSILSMCTSVLFGGVLGLVALAHTLVLVIFIGGGFGFLGWIKSSMNNPLVNVGSTLASLAIIGVVTKEAAVVTHVFSNQKIFQIFQMLVFAIATTTTVNLLVWRVSAVSLLRISMGKASGCLGDMLAQITISFLDGSPGSLSSEEFIAASSSYSTLHPQLARNLRESKFERYFWGDENLYQLDRAVVKSIETLAQSIGGLRSAATTQFTLLEESHALSPSEPAKPVSDAGWSSTLSRDPSALSTNDKTGVTALSAIEEVSGKSAGQDRSDGNNDSKATRPVQTVQLRNASDIFDFFISLLGPSMKSLAYTLSEVLGEQPFGSSPDFKVTVNDNFRHSLTEALFLFNAARADALEKLYKRLQLRGARSEKLQGDFEEVAAACGHFSFSLQTFGEEMQKYLGILDDLKHEGDHRTRTWRWLQWWRSRSDRSYLTSALPYNVEERESLIKPIKKTAMPNIPEPILKRRDTFNWEATPTANRMVARFSQRLLQLLRKLAKDDGKCLRDLQLEI